MKQILTEEQTEKIAELANKGYRQCDIARELNLSANMVRYWFAKSRDAENTVIKATKKCGTCKYRSRICCEYILVTGKKRGCSPYGCDKYEKGSFLGTTPIDGYGFALVSHNRKQFNQMAYSQEDKGV